MSSRSQDHAYQRAAIERAALARGETIAEWFAERESGRRLERPELERLRQAVRQGDVTRVWVWRLDRLTRSGIRDTLALLDEFRERGAELITIADPFALEGPAAEVILSVLAWAAKAERTKIEENQAAARQKLEASGGSWGRPRRVDRETEARIWDLQGRGHSVRQIARMVQLPKTVVGRVVSRKGAYAPTSGAAQNKPGRPSSYPPSL